MLGTATLEYFIRSTLFIYLADFATSPVHAKYHFKNEECRKNVISYHLVGLTWLRQRDQQLKIGSKEHSSLAYFRVIKEGL